MSLKYCPTCNEDSIVSVTKTRKKDGAITYFEYCSNKNPKCRYKHYRIVKKGSVKDENKKEGHPGYRNPADKQLRFF